MRLWKRAYGALKDKNSILIANLSIKKTSWNSEFEVAIIKSTSHDESKLDYKNTRRVFAWLHASPDHLTLLLCSLSLRLQKTRCWVVAIKGLVLIHGALRCNTLAVRKIGRLPFDLSDYKDSCRKSGGFLGLDDFVQSYFSFLDQRTAFLFLDRNGDEKGTESALVQELVKVRQWQTLLDMLLQIKPELSVIEKGLVYEVMDCLVIEIFSFYNRIRNGISRLLSGVSAARKVEAAMVLEVLQKACNQNEHLSRYMSFCRENGVGNASKFPKIEPYHVRHILEVEQIVNRGTEDQAMVVKRLEPEKKEEEEPKWVLKTIITDKWEVFDEDPLSSGKDFPGFLGNQTVVENPCPAPLNYLPYQYELPDLITF